MESCGSRSRSRMNEEEGEWIEPQDRGRDDPHPIRLGEETEASSGGESEWLERGDHPLLNDLILEKILFGFVRRCDLTECRIVSKKWNLSTIPHMRATFKVTIHGTERNIKDRQVEDFVKLFGNQAEIPFAKFQLGAFCTTEGVGQQFLHLCGESAQEIHFVTTDGPQILGIEDVSELLKSCLNLKVLRFPYNMVSRSGNIVKLFPDSIPNLSALNTIKFVHHSNVRQLCPTFIQDLLTAARNVSKIVVNDNGNGNESGDEDPSDISALLNSIEILGMESSIQSLSLYGVRDQHIQHLQRMAKNGLKLTSLTVDRQFHMAFFDTVQLELASIFRHTLQHLDVGNKVGEKLMEFPTIPNLKSLTLRYFQHFFHQPVDLTQKFPALETLDLDLYPGCTSRVLNNCFSEFLPCETLTALRIHEYASLAFGIQTFHNILRVFPNLTEIKWSICCLREDGGGEVLGQIWTRMTGLVSMSISGCAGSGSAEELELELDSLFTGIPTQRLKEILHVGITLSKMPVEERRDKIRELQNDYCRLPSIRNLTNLTHLDLDVTGRNNNLEREIHLSDVTAYLAFYSMNHIHHLKVKDCLFSRTCCEILKNDMELETWSFLNAEDEHIIPPFILH